MEAQLDSWERCFVFTLNDLREQQRGECVNRVDTKVLAAFNTLATPFETQLRILQAGGAAADQWLVKRLERLVALVREVRAGFQSLMPQ